MESVTTQMFLAITFIGILSLSVFFSIQKVINTHCRNVREESPLKEEKSQYDYLLTHGNHASVMYKCGPRHEDLRVLKGTTQHVTSICLLDPF